MTEAIVTRTTKTGRTLEIRVRRDILDQFSAVATLDGERAASGTPQKLDRATARKLPGFTHYIPDHRAPIALTTAEAEALSAAIAAAERDDPATQARALRDERRNLVGDVLAAIEGQSDAFERAHAREDVRAWDIKLSHEPKIEAAQAALAAFDAAHPEIVAAIRAEKAEAAERFARTN